MGCTIATCGCTAVGGIQIAIKEQADSDAVPTIAAALPAPLQSSSRECHAVHAMQLRLFAEAMCGI